jgi:hypothetical protein
MEDEDAIREVLRRRHHAVVTNQPEGIASLLHDQFFYVNAIGETYNKAQFLKYLFDPASPRTISPEPQNERIEITDTVATVTYEFDGTFLLNGRPHSGHFRIFHTLVKTDGRWVFLAGHFG